MKKIIKLIFLCMFSLILAANCVGCAGKIGNGQTEQEEHSLFKNGNTAAEYLYGIWTDGQSNFFKAFPSDNPLSKVSFSYNITANVHSELQMIEDGKVIGAHKAEDGDLQREEILEFTYIDENSMRIKCLKDGTESLYIREKEEIDTDSLDDGYVFRTANRAGAYLTGVWTDREDNILSYSVSDSGEPNWASTLTMPECEGTDFAFGCIAAVRYDEEGNKSVEPLYELHIIDRDHLRVISKSEDFDGEFRREKDTLPEDKDELNEYVFWNSLSAYNFLNGLWSDSLNHYFGLNISEEYGLRWASNLQRAAHYTGYSFSENQVIGENKDGGTEAVYTITANSPNEIGIYNHFLDKSYTLQRYLKETE